jgi:FtsP/CotA-like multicopper oxidase with cupredoxin domain
VPVALPPTPPAHALVFETEDRLSPSRGGVPAGRLVLQARNIGQDDHDVTIRTSAGRVVATTGVVRPGALGTIRVRLPRGRYLLYCSIADHEALGMQAPLTVRRPARRPARRR